MADASTDAKLEKMDIRRAFEEKQISDGEVWSAIRYLDPESRAGVGSLMVSVAMCWLILFLSAMYLSFHLRR
ncbi:MAG: hypothetical protein DMG64_01915 [Acidobacteria bacterium]|nr:MAG: hypothetical protein DMG63_17540 [Acidobacteriota bacterium]PYY06035.1 MAG: hypothetical protein DMG64_01915 [Acidobacteriota bacterium]PYY21097.1 MAG: hypothetical protein DMG62_20225 [Acidobacteriota bacterium]